MRGARIVIAVIWLLLSAWLVARALQKLLRAVGADCPPCRNAVEFRFNVYR